MMSLKSLGVRNPLPHPAYSTAHDWQILASSWLAVFPKLDVKLYEECQDSLCEQLFDMAGADFACLARETPAQRVNVSQPFRMPPQQARAWLEIYRESNRAVARQFFGRDELFDERDLAD